MSTHTPRHAAPRTARRGLAATGVLSIALAGGAFTFAGAGSASAATTLAYTCNTAVGDKDVTVDISTNAPATGTVGTPISVTKVTGTITLDGGLGNAMAGYLGWHAVSGVTPNVVTVSGPTGTTTQNVQLTTAKTPIFDSAWVNDGTYGGFGPDGHLVLPLSGNPNTTMTPSAAGTYTITAPDTFKSTFTGTKADGTTGSTDSSCTYKSGTKTINSIVVSAASSKPSTSSSSSSTPTTSKPSSTSSSPTSTTSKPSSTSSTSTTSKPSTSAPTPSTAKPTTPAPSSTSSKPSSTSTANSTAAPTSSTASATSSASSTAAPSSSSSSTTVMPTGGSTTTPSAPSKPATGPKVDTDLLSQKDGLNVLGVGFAAAGVVALGGAALLGRRRSA